MPTPNDRKEPQAPSRRSGKAPLDGEDGLEHRREPARGKMPPPIPAVAAARADAAQKAAREEAWDRGVVLFLLFVAFGAGTWFFFGQRGGHPPPGTRVFGQIETNGSLRRRFAGELHWRDLRSGDDVFLDDVVYVPAGSETRIVREGHGALPMRLPEDAMVAVREDGPVVLDFEERQPGSLDPLPDPEGLALRLNELTQRWLRRPERLDLLDVGPAPYGQYPLDKLAYFRLFLVTPVELTLKFKTYTWYDTVWTPIPIDGVSFTIEVSKDSKFERFLSYNSRRSRLAIQLDQGGIYYWRVRATLREEYAKSPSAKFTLSRHGMDLPGATGAVPQAKMTGYTAEIARDAEFQRILFMNVVSQAACPPGALKPGNYYCRLLPIGGGGQQRVYEFEVTSDRRAVRTSDVELIANTKRERSLAVQRKSADGGLGVIDPNGFTAEISGTPDFRSIVGSSLEGKAECPTDGLPPGSYYCRIKNPGKGGVRRQYRFDVAR